MAPCSPSQNLDGSYHSCADRYFTGICRRTIQNCSRSAVYALCLRYADRRQLHQRPLRLPERYRPYRPSGPGTCLRTRLDYTGSHESGNRCHCHSFLYFRSRTAIHKLGRTAPWRMGTHCAGSILRNICLPLYHRPLLSRLGRLTGADILRLCSGRRHILCAGIYIHPKRHHCFAHQRTGNRYLISCEQLSRSRSGCPQRKTYAHRPFRRTFRQIPLPLARHHRDVAFLLVCPRLELCRYLHAFHLPLFPRNYLETHGKDTKR